MSAGILTHEQIEALVEAGAIASESPLDAIQVQPTSLDLRLGGEALVLRSGFLPTRGSVASTVASLVTDRIDLTSGAVLRRGGVYLVRLLESLALPPHVSARANPRSSTGRIDVFTRTVVDGQGRFDDVPAGYHGPLWLEIVPRSFDIAVTTGMRLNQARFVRGDPLLSDAELAERLVRDTLVLGADDTTATPPVLDGALLLGLSLIPEQAGRPVGWRALERTPVLDLARPWHHAPEDFFSPVHPESDGTLILQPEAFYILASSERLRVPPDLSAEMLPWDVGMGELRTNYAGFFDSGFGWNPSAQGVRGARAVLEVRPHDVPFRVEHEQPIFRLQFSRTVEPCRRLYGGADSAYQHQGLALARYFRPPRDLVAD